MKLILIALISLAALLAVLWLIGRGMPREHTARAEAVIPASLTGIYAVLDGSQTWRSTVADWQDLGLVNGARHWREKDKRGEWIEYELLEAEAPIRRISHIVSPGLPFGGTWKIELSPRGEQTLVTIEENGFVDPPLFRVLARYVFGHETTMRQFLKDLNDHIQRSQHGPRNPVPSPH